MSPAAMPGFGATTAFTVASEVGHVELLKQTCKDAEDTVATIINNIATTILVELPILTKSVHNTN